MKELRRTLLKKFHLSHDETALAMEPIKEAIEQNIEHDLKITDIGRDADDDNIIACAVAAKADYRDRRFRSAGDKKLQGH